MSELHSLPRLAQALGLNREWLRREALAGRIPCLRVGRRLVFSLPAVEAAIARRAAQSHLPEECVR